MQAIPTQFSNHDAFMGDVSQIVVLTGGMVDGVTTAAGGTPFQIQQLIDGTGMIEQIDTNGVEQR